MFYFPSNLVLLRMLTKYNVPLKELAKVLEFDCLHPKNTINDHTKVEFLRKIFKLINNINSEEASLKLYYYKLLFLMNN